MNPTVELVLKHKKANMRKSDFLMLEALKSAPHLNDSGRKLMLWRGGVTLPTRFLGKIQPWRLSN
jgi:hypothetical protein